jgi:flagellar biogenesis protein FliO
MSLRWLWLLGGSMLILIGVQLIISWLVMRVLEELGQREIKVQLDLQTKR